MNLIITNSKNIGASQYPHQLFKSGQLQFRGNIVFLLSIVSGEGRFASLQTVQENRGESHEERGINQKSALIRLAACALILTMFRSERRHFSCAASLHPTSTTVQYHIFISRRILDFCNPTNNSSLFQLKSPFFNPNIRFLSPLDLVPAVEAISNIPPLLRGRSLLEKKRRRRI